MTLNSADWSGVDTTSYRVDGGPWTIYTGPFSIGTDGGHTVEFFSTDLSGNVEAVRSVALNVDATPPTITSLRPTGAVTTDDVALSWNGADNTSGVAEYRISIDGQAFESIGKRTNLNVHLSDGTHHFEIQVLDGAGNIATGSTRFQVDTYAFSLTGPYRGVPTLLLATAIAVAPPLLYAFYSRRKKGEGSR